MQEALAFGWPATTGADWMILPGPVGYSNDEYSNATGDTVRYG